MSVACCAVCSSLLAGARFAPIYTDTGGGGGQGGGMGGGVQGAGCRGVCYLNRKFYLNLKESKRNSKSK